MKVFCLLIAILLFANPIIIHAQELSSQQEQSLPEVEIDFDKMINFDELEDEMVKMNIMETIQPIPPHPAIVWLRIIGLPIANAYFAARRVVRTGVQKFAAFFHLTLHVKAHEVHEEPHAK